MIYPVNKIAISQGHHYGKCLDFGWHNETEKNQDILAIDAGTVISVEKQKNGGNTIYIKHNNGFVSCYCHLSKILVKKGGTLNLGDVIGKMGKSGNVTGEHLHFGLYSSKDIMYNHSDLDPFDFLEMYPQQEITSDKTKETYGDKIKIHEEDVPATEEDVPATEEEEDKTEILDLVKRTIRGDFGNGANRKNILGDNYEEVQKQVNLNIKNGTTNWDNIKLY